MRGEFLYKPDQIKGFFEYFKNTWRDDEGEGTELETLVDVISKAITDEDNEELVRDVSAQEALVVVRAMPSDKSLRPDGMSGMFYKRFWRTV